MTAIQELNRRNNLANRARQINAELQLPPPSLEELRNIQSYQYTPNNAPIATNLPGTVEDQLTRRWELYREQAFRHADQQAIAWGWYVRTPEDITREGKEGLIRNIRQAILTASAITRTTLQEIASAEDHHLISTQEAVNVRHRLLNSTVVEPIDNNPYWAGVRDFHSDFHSMHLVRRPEITPPEKKSVTVLTDERVKRKLDLE